MVDRFCLSLAILTWATGLVSPGGAVSLAPHPKKSIDAQRRPPVLVQDNGEQDEPQNRSVRVGGRIYRLTVIDNETGETILTFDLNNTFSARGFLIDEEETVAIAQSLSVNPPFEEMATFLNIDTGEEIARLPERVYGFSEDESLLVTRNPQEMAIYSYPNLTERCRLTGEYWGYPISTQFSPSHRFLLVYVFSMDIDMRMPRPSTGEVGWFQLFDIEECEKVSEFPGRWIISDPVFSDDSRFLYLGEGHVCLREGIEDNCRFNLTTYEVESF